MKDKIGSGHGKKRPLKSKILSFRCKGKGVITGEQEIMNQISIAHKYHNALIENERNRRKGIQEERDKRYPKLAALRSDIDRLVGLLKEVREKIKGTNAKARKKINPSDDAQAQIKLLKKQIKELSTEEKPLREICNQDADLQLAWIQCEAKHNISKDGNGLRDKFAKQGLHFGTYQQVERQMQASRKASKGEVKFRRWTGEGKIRINVGQADKGKGLSYQQIVVGQCKQIKLGRKQLTSKNGKETYWVDFAELKINKDTIAEVHFVMDRPIEGEIRDICLVRRKISTHFYWQLQFVVAKPEEWQKEWKQAETGMVGIDVGWRLVESGLRVAYWHGTDGQEGEIVIPQERIKRMKKVRDLESIRALEFNKTKSLLGAWLETQPPIPEWLAERTKTLPHWKASSQARLASILLHWRNNRFENDNLFDQLEAWREQDKHLYTWQEFQRKADQNWRESFYRQQLQILAERYHYCVLEDGLPTFKKAKAEATEVDWLPTAYRNLASNGRFHQLAIETFPIAIKVNPAYTTKQCNACKVICEELDASKLKHTCECGAEWDIDANASKNLLDAGQGLDLLTLKQRKTDKAWILDEGNEEAEEAEMIDTSNELAMLSGI